MHTFFPSVVRRTALLLLICLSSKSLQAQSDLPPVSLAQLARPNSWQLVGSVSPTADASSMRTQSGSNVLVGSNEPLTLLTPTDDFRLRFEVMLSAGADAVLTLPTGQQISFANSRESARLVKAPGLWQTIDVWYKTKGPKSSSTLEKLALNGVTVRESQTLANNKLGPLTVMTRKGTIALRKVGYRVMSPRMVAQWSSPLSYTIVEGGYIQNPQDAMRRKVLKQDTTSQLTYEVSYGQSRQYTIFFAGKLNALQTGDYQFDLNQGGLAALWIDGKEVIPINHLELGMPNPGTVSLTAGPHDVKVYFSRSWFRPGLGLFVSQAGTRPQPLHAQSSLPEPDPVAVVSINPDYSDPMNQVQRIRSFVQMPGEKTKRTHSLSVGSPTGIHYTIDLNQMALLQVWKGDFANTTEMWYERGEPQLLSPLGAVVHLPGQTPLMVLTNDSATWPDSVSENTLQYKGLTIDKQGKPTLQYMLAGAIVTDDLRPEGDALVRTLTLIGSPNGTPYCRVAAGTSVEEVGKGLYAINDRSYYVRFDPKAKVKLRQSNGKQELLLPVELKNGAGSVQYSIVF
ncbi:PA14 domain-containing protein [Spirosoma gilvum]